MVVKLSKAQNLNIDLDTVQSQRKPKYSWLLSDYPAKVWKLRLHIVSDDLSRYTINWFEGELLELSGWFYWVEMAKKQAAVKMEQAKLMTSTLAMYCRNLKAFFRFLFINRRCLHLGDVTIIDVEAYKRLLIAKKLSESALINYMIPVDDTYFMRRDLTEPLTFNPFPNETKTAWAKANCKAKGHTKTILPREIFYLLNEALKLIKHSEKDLELLSKYMRERQECLSNGRRTGYQHAFKKQYGISGKKLIEKIRLLYGASLMITFLLTAERKHEAGLRECNDVAALLDKELDILYGLEKKTSGSSSGKITSVAVIEEVRNAFKVILNITQYKRRDSGITKVLLKMPIGHSVSGGSQKSYYLTTQSMYILLEHFVTYCGLDLKLRPHMLRRAYAMLWCWRYEIGDLEELSIMLKHNNNVFTEKYTNDEDIWHFMPEVEQKMAFDILTNALSKKVTISGGASETLERYGRIVQARSRLLNAAAIAKFIDDLLLSGDVRIIPHADGYCVITKNTQKESRCLDGDGELSAELREASRCVGCPNLAVDDKRRYIWEKRIEQHQKVVDVSSNMYLIAASKKFIDDARNVIFTSIEC